MAIINPAKTVELAVIFVFLPLYYLSLNNTDNNSAGSCKDNIFFLEGIKQVWNQRDENDNMDPRFRIYSWHEHSGPKKET